MGPATDDELPLAALAAAVESAEDGFLVLDGEGRLRSWNRSALRLLGRDEAMLRGALVRDAVDVPDLTAWDRCWERAAAGVPVRQVELAVRRPDGTTVPVLVSATPVRVGDRPVASVSLVLRDITEQKLAQATLAHNAKRLMESEALAHVGSWVWDAESDTVQWSQEQHRIHGLEPHEFDGTLEAHLSRVHPSDRAGVSRAMRRAVRRGTALDRRFRVIRPDGAVRWVYARAAREDAGASGLSGIYHDITDSHEHAQALQRSNEQLTRLALYDDLTGLPSRSLFMERLQHSLDGRAPDPLVVCFVDLDDFKAVNDVLGHATGDALLRAVGERLTAALRPIDTAARFGGDEFAILLEKTTLEDAHEVAQRLLRLVAHPVALDGAEVVVHASIGLAPASEAGTDPERLLAEADAAAYAAKALGGHRVEVFAQEMRVAIERRSRVRSEIEHALDSGEFCLDYQPIVDLHDGSRHGVEALVRWEHPERGLLLPRDFIEVAEASGQIRAVDRWVLQEACRTAVQLPPDTVMSVNLSARQLQEPDLVDFVTGVLEATGMPSERLVLEITETAALFDIQATVVRLGELRALGLTIALDDFGTGYSPLSHLRRLPADYLKIDRSFVRGLAGSEADRAIVRGVIDMAQALGLQTIAEGVEDATQRDVLRHFGCELGQGYFWAAPMRPEHLMGWSIPAPRHGSASSPLSGRAARG